MKRDKVGYIEEMSPGKKDSSNSFISNIGIRICGLEKKYRRKYCHEIHTIIVFKE